MNYVRYNTDTGLILGSGECPIEMFQSTQAPGTALLEAQGSSMQHYVINGALVNYTPGEMVAKISLKPGFVWKMPERVAFDTRTAAQALNLRLFQISTQCDTTLSVITDSYPVEEQKTWDKQEMEARAYTANNTASTPLLSALSVARGITVTDLAARIIAKANAFAIASGHAIGMRQKYEDQLSVPGLTREQIDAIVT